MKSFGNSLFLVLVLTILAQAQQPAPSRPGATGTPTPSPKATSQEEEVGEGEIIRIKASLVSVPVSVMDRDGKYVVDLRQKDFRVFEDGAEQPITHFSNVDQPLSVVLLMDTSGSTASFLDQIKQSAEFFVEQLRPTDAVQPVYFHGEIRSLTPGSTSDPAVLRTAIDQMSSGPSNMGTRLYDAVDFVLHGLRTAPARKAVILFTDGENTWGKATMKGTLKDAEESDIVIYTLQYGDDPPQKYLQQLAERTGGRYFKTPNVNTFKQSFADIAAELRRQYVIGYYPKQLSQTGQEKKIKVKVDREHVVVRARRSYTYNP